MTVGSTGLEHLADPTGVDHVPQISELLGNPQADVRAAGEQRRLGVLLVSSRQRADIGRCEETAPVAIDKQVPFPLNLGQ